MKTALDIQKLADQLFPVTEDEDEPEVKDIPPEQRRLHTETADYTVSTLVELLNENKIRVPGFQRGYVWNRSQASRLIESLIIQCPIPVVYLSQERNGTRIVIDGQQRLSSIKLFLNGAIELQGLTTYPELNGYTADQLDPRFLDHIKNRTIRCITILRDTHPQIRFDVFERLNTGSVKLNSQELRNGLNQGRLMELVNSLSADKTWKAVTSTKKDKRMKGAELVLRFFAMKQNWKRYQKPLSVFLDTFSEDYKNIDQNKLIEWQDEFDIAFRACLSYFGNDVFKMYNKDTGRHVTFNSAVFDAQMVGISESRNEHLLACLVDREKVYDAFLKLYDDSQFVASVQRATSDDSAVARRIGDAIDVFSRM